MNASSNDPPVSERERLSYLFCLCVKPCSPVCNGESGKAGSMDSDWREREREERLDLFSLFPHIHTLGMLGGGGLPLSMSLML